MSNISALLVVLLCVLGCHGYRTFQTEIPNGDHVPHPCQANFLWHGVGHLNAQGGGPRNPFGQDFAAAGHKWTEELCRKDSDGDGQTNGQELGDPNCVWSKDGGKAPQNIKDISHPGVCDPWNEGQCIGRNDWLDCTRDLEFKCPYVNEPDVRNITIRFPRTKVPAKETHYVCFNFELPSDQVYHLIAHEPFIDNPNVMHHMILNTCQDSVKLLDEPTECLMGTPGCGETVAGWTLGQTGDCYDPAAGFKIGKGGATIVSLQHHWTNPGLVDEWTDSSGMVLYYTPKLRQYNAAVMNLGQRILNIPPGQEQWVEQGTCTSGCSRKIMAEPIHVTAVLHHMHYLGIRQNVTLRRGGTGPVETVTDDNPFNYDSPVTHKFETPLMINPGDELRVKCTFQSRSRSKTTTYGEGSFDEMCVTFLWYYPAEAISTDKRYCGQWKEYNVCNMDETCDLATQMNYSVPAVGKMFNTVMENCDPSGVECRHECPAVLADVRRNFPCVGQMWDYTKWAVYKYIDDKFFYKWANAIESCPMVVMTPTTPTPATTPRPVTPRPAEPAGPGSMLMDVLKMTDAKPLLQNVVMNVNYNYANTHNNEQH